MMFESPQELGPLKHFRYTDMDISNRNIYLVSVYLDDSVTKAAD